MKKLLIHITIVTGLFFVFDRLLGGGLGLLYSQSNATDEYKISYEVNSVNVECLNEQ